jgi:hypothetical protein
MVLLHHSRVKATHSMAAVIEPHQDLLLPQRRSTPTRRASQEKKMRTRQIPQRSSPALVQRPRVVAADMEDVVVMDMAMVHQAKDLRAEVRVVAHMDMAVTAVVPEVRARATKVQEDAMVAVDAEVSVGGEVVVVASPSVEWVDLVDHLEV